MTAGRDNISARALEKVVRAVAADQFEVPVSEVTAELADADGGLQLAIRTPVRVVSIARAQSEPRAVERSGGTVLERAEEGRAVIASRVEELTGSEISGVRLRFSGAHIRQERRVR